MEIKLLLMNRACLLKSKYTINLIKQTNKLINHGGKVLLFPLNALILKMYRSKCINKGKSSIGYLRFSFKMFLLNCEGDNGSN